MAVNVAEVGYQSAAFRGASEIEKVKSIEPPAPTRSKIDTTHLKSPNFAKESIAGPTEFPTMKVICIAEEGATVQEAIESDYYTGVKTPEAWSYTINDPEDGSVERTYSFSGYIASCVRAPLEFDAVKLLTIEIQLTTAVTIT